MTTTTAAPAPSAAPATTNAPTVIDSIMAETERYRRALEPQSQDEGWRLANEMATLKLHGVDTPANGMARIMTGRSLGLSAMASIQTINLIWNPKANDGQGTFTTVMYARAKLALLYAAHKVIEYIYPVELTNERATWVGKRRGSPKEIPYTFTVEDARIAGLVDRGSDDKGKAGNNYNKHPGPMLEWRACGRLCDILGADILLGIATREDVEDEIRQQRELTEAATEFLAKNKTLEEKLAERPAPTPPPPIAAGVAAPRDFEAEAAQIKRDILEAVKTKDAALKRRVRATFQSFEASAPRELTASLLEFYSATMGKSAVPATSHRDPKPENCMMCGKPVEGDSIQTNDGHGVVGIRHPTCAPFAEREREPGEEG
jgi:hypothetical protein